MSVLIATRGVSVPVQRSRPHRINVDLDADTYKWLAVARRDDRLTTSDRVRALIALSRQDPELRARVVEMATQLEEEADLRRNASG